MFQSSDKKLLFIMFAAVLINLNAAGPYPLEQFVQRYLIFHQSKMRENPVAWQEVKEGHLRTKAIIYSENLFDSLKVGKSHFEIATIHFPKLIEMRWDVYGSDDYMFVIKKEKYKENYNYFSSSND